MNLQHLSYIAEMERCGSISKAAKKLYVSQPYLSRILRETEEEFQITIFIRGKNGIAPTESGRLFLDMAKDLLGSAERFQKTFEERRESYRLRVSSCASSFPMDAFIRMINRIPEMDLRFSYREGSNPDVINDIYTGSADIGVITMTKGNQKMAEDLLRARRIVCRKIFDMGACLVLREGHPLLAAGKPPAIEDLYQYNFVLYPSEQESGPHAIENIYSDSSLNLINWNRIHQVIHVHSRAALHNILTRTDFLSLGGTAVLEQEKNFRLVSVPFPFASKQQEEQEAGSILCSIRLRDRELPPSAKLFERALIEYCGQNISKS